MTVATCLRRRVRLLCVFERQELRAVRLTFKFISSVRRYVEDVDVNVNVDEAKNMAKMNA